MEILDLNLPQLRIEDREQRIVIAARICRIWIVNVFEDDFVTCSNQFEAIEAMVVFVQVMSHFRVDLHGLRDLLISDVKTKQLVREAFGIALVCEE